MSPTRRKTTVFRELLRSARLEFILEAHNGLSARIAEEAGFSGIWASGLALAAQFGVRDNNEASWSQIVDMVEFMADATRVPIMLDGDTGYGNFNNLRRLVKKLEQRSVAAVCIEDKLFPKQNSFVEGETQPLADMEEFCGKIKAGKDTQADDDFSIVARVEALIAGWGLDEALKRADAYVEAGADAILIHSAKSTPHEVLAFKREWGERAPLVIVPTKYCMTPTDEFRRAGFSMVIWANHLLRSSLEAMRRTARTLAEEESASSVEDRVATLSEVFELQGAPELKAAEKRFLPGSGRRTRAVVLAASRGSDLRELTESKPKTMIAVRGKPILAHIVSTYNRCGIKDVAVVRGYKKQSVALPGVRVVDNDRYAETGELHSLGLFLETLEEPADDLIVSYGDVLFHSFLLRALIDAGDRVAVAVDTSWVGSAETGRRINLVSCSKAPSREAFYDPPVLRHVAADIPAADCHGEWTGFLKLPAGSVALVRELTAELLHAAEDQKPPLAVLLNALVAREQPVEVLYTTGHWLDVDSVTDIERAGRFR